MNREKAAYFDSQVGADWAAQEYTPDERERIDEVLTLAGWNPQMRILEPGCGSGRLTQILAERAASPGFVVAADISREMTEACRRRLEGNPCATVQCAAVESMETPRDSFDLVMLHQVFPHFDDKARALSTFADCLKKGGKIVVLHFINAAQINDMHRKVDPSVMRDSMPSQESMREMFQQAGFSVDRLKDDDKGYLLLATRL